MRVDVGRQQVVIRANSRGLGLFLGARIQRWRPLFSTLIKERLSDQPKSTRCRQDQGKKDKDSRVKATYCTAEWISGKACEESSLGCGSSLPGS